MSRGSGDVGTAGRLRKLGSDVGTTALAAVGAALALAGSPWSVLWLTLALAGLVGRAVVMRRQAPSVNLLTTQLAQRCALGAALAVTLAVGDRAALPAALGSAVLLAGVLYEPYLRPGTLLRVPLAFHLPGVEPPEPRRDLTRRVLRVDAAVVALGLLLAVLGVSAWWWLPLTLAAPAVRVQVARDGHRRAARLRRFPDQLRVAVARYAPEMVVYTAWGAADGAHQVTMWLPYLQRTGRRCLIVTRSAAPAAAVAAATDLPVVEARGPEDLDLLVPPSLTVAFYPNASSGNGLYVRYQQLTHVFLGHGDSDKPTSYNPTHAMYDRIFCAGPAGVRRYADHGIAIDREKFEVVGRPQVEGIEPARAPLDATASPVVLYAPTWRGHVSETSLSSLAVGERLVQQLLDAGTTVIFRPHPFSRGFAEDAATIRRIQTLLTADRARTGRAHVVGAEAESRLSIAECCNGSDVLVSDVSSVVSDYLFSGKPYLLVAVPTEPDAFRAEYPLARGAYVVRGDLADLAPTLQTLLSTDPLRETRAEIRADYLGPFPTQGYADVFVAAVERLAGGDRQHRESEEMAAADLGQAAEEASPAAGPAPDGSGPGGAGPETGAPDGGGEAPGGEAPAAAVAARVRGTRRRRLRRRLVTDRRWAQGAAMLALAALVVGVAGGPGPAGAVAVAVLGVAALGAVYRTVEAAVRRRKRWSRLLGEARGTRVVLAGAAVASAGGDGSGVAAVVVAAAALVLVWGAAAAEPHVQRTWGRFGLVARNLPEPSTAVTEPMPRGVLAMAGGVAVAVLLVLAVVAPPVALLVPAGLLLVPTVVVVSTALVRAARVVRAEQQLATELERRAPQFVVYFASTVGAGYQLGMWLPYFARLGRPFVVVTRVADTMAEITRTLDRAGVDVPVLHRPSIRSLEDVIVPSLTTVFYVNNAVRNTHFIERRELTHVWLNHGDSEKPACFNPVHAIYDLLFAAGRAGVERYARHGVHIPAEKFRIVGRPQVEVIQFRQPDAPPRQPATVLYAPTWQGPYADTRVYSLPVALPIVERLLERGVRVVFRAHPLNYQFPESAAMVKKVGRLLARHRAETGVEHLWGAAAETALTVEECFNLSDAMLADISAVVSDYLYADKPFGIVAVGRTTDRLVEEAPAARAGSVLLEDLSNLDRVLDDLLRDDPLAAARADTRRHYLGDVDRPDYATGFVEAALAVIDGADRPCPSGAAR